LPPKEFYGKQIAGIHLSGRHVFLFQLLPGSLHPDFIRIASSSLMATSVRGFPLRFSNPEYNMEYEVSND
jgi:hypothetical protein